VLTPDKMSGLQSFPSYSGSCSNYLDTFKRASKITGHTEFTLVLQREEFDL